MKTKLILDNIKCAGCINTIRKGIKSFPQVQEVAVDAENDQVEITHATDLPLPELKEKLAALGYPEKGTLGTLHKFNANARSFVSCAIGKITKNE